MKIINKNIGVKNWEYNELSIFDIRGLPLHQSPIWLKT